MQLRTPPPRARPSQIAILASPLSWGSVAPDVHSATADPGVEAQQLEAGVNTDNPPLNVDDFIANFKQPLPQPILSTPRLHRTKSARIVVDEDWVPKRSARLAAKSRFRDKSLKPRQGK